MLRDVAEFLPPGTRVKSPGGLSIDLSAVVEVGADQGSPTTPYVRVRYARGDQTFLRFHRNVDGGPPDVHAIKRNIEEARNLLLVESEAAAPIPMILHCPWCRERHVDRGEFAVRPHHTHACQACGHVWRPAIVATVGVRFLPGFKDEAPAAKAAEPTPATKAAEKMVSVLVVPEL